MASPGPGSKHVGEELSSSVGPDGSEGSEGSEGRGRGDFGGGVGAVAKDGEPIGIDAGAAGGSIPVDWENT